MSREARRTHHTPTAEEIERSRARRKMIEEELPDLIARNERRAVALQEQSFSGELRRAVAASQIHPEDLARAAGIDLADLADFMAGDAPLSTVAVDRLAEQLRCRLVQTN